MSLPIAGGGPKQPSREPTHKPADHKKLLRLGLSAEEAADGEAIRCDAIEELALEEGADPSHVYAAVALTTEIAFAREHEVAFVACAGKCQSWGALDVIDELTILRQRRIDDGQPAFDVQARSCLDRCEHAPVVMIHTPNGTAVLTQATRTTIAEAVGEAIG